MNESGLMFAYGFRRVFSHTDISSSLIFLCEVSDSLYHHCSSISVV